MSYRTLLCSLTLFVSSGLVCSIPFALRAQEVKTLVTMKGHTDPVYGVAVSSDSQIAATGSFDKSIRLWDMKSGRLLRSYAGPGAHQGLVLSVAFSPAGDLLASGGADNVARIWDVPSSQPAKTFAVGGPIRSLALSPDSKTIATGLADGKIRLHDAEGKPLAELAGHTGEVNHLAFLAGGQVLASRSRDATLRFWSAPGGKAIARFGLSADSTADFGAHPTGAAVYTSSPGTVIAWPPQITPARKVFEQATPISGFELIGNGSTFFTSSTTITYQLVNASTGKSTVTFTPRFKAGLASSAANGTLIASHETGGVVRLQTPDGKSSTSIELAGITPSSLALHPKGTQLIVGDDKGQVHVWTLPVDARNPSKSASFAVHNGEVRHLTFRPDGTVISAGADKKVKLLDVAQKKELKTIGTLTDAAIALTASADGAEVAAASGKYVRVWSVADGKERSIEVPSPAISLAFNTRRDQLLIGTQDRAAWLCDLASGKLLFSLLSDSPVTAVAFAPGQPVAYITNGNTIEAHTIPAIKTIHDAGFVQGPIAVGQDPNHLITIPSGNQLPLWSLASLNRERTIEAKTPISEVASSKNGSVVAVAGGTEPGIQLYSKNDGRLAGSFSTPASVSQLLFLPNNSLLAARIGRSQIVLFNVAFAPGQPFPAEAGEIVQQFSHGSTVSQFALTSDGSQLVTGSEDGSVRFWRIASSQPLKSFNHPNLVDSVAFDPRGTLLATACHDGNVRLFDVAKGGQPIKTIAAHTQPQPSPIYIVIWSPDGKQLVTGSFDRSIKFWDASAGTLVREIRPGSDLPPPSDAARQTAPAVIGASASVRLSSPPHPGHRDQVFCLAFSPDAKLLASGSSDRMVKVWNVATGELVTEFHNPAIKPVFVGDPNPSHPGFIHAVRFTPDGKRVVSVGTAPRNTGYLAVWNLADGLPIRTGETGLGPIFSFDWVGDGSRMLLGCGPRQRNQSTSEAHIIETPR